ncbi:MAG TPA: hypothetical protein VL625_01165 [Patescibacteria group bacterium]|nr:hypothetical protein [Patescibacteria group bacterium]
MSEATAPAEIASPSPGGGAPVVLATDEAALAPLFRYMAAVAPQNHVALAHEEAARLQLYFTALSRHLQDDLNADPSLFAGKRDRVEKLITPGNLTRLFLTVAEQTNKIMLSEIIIAPSAVYDDNSLTQRVFGSGQTPYHSTSRYDGHVVHFGFDKLFERDADRNKLSETALGVITFDDAMLKNVAAYAPGKMAGALQAVATMVNHDMLHHIHMDTGAPARFMDKKPSGFHMNNPRDIWLRNFPFDFEQVPKVDDIESFLIMHQAKTMQYLDREPLREAVTGYFGELARIGAAMKEKAADAADPAAALKEAHETINYFSTVMGVTLLRFLPINDPLMQGALAGMERADPAPEYLMAQEKITHETLRGRLRYDGTLRGIMENYKAQGYTIADPEAETLTYRQIKLLHLINDESMVCELISRARPGSYLSDIQKKNGRIGLEMIDAMAKMTDFEPT